MSTDDYEAAKRIFESEGRPAHFVGGQPGWRVRKAEERLGVAFPPTYRSFLREYGAGSFGSREFYGVLRDDVEDSGVPDVVWRTLCEREKAPFPRNLVPVYHFATGDLACLQLTDGEARVIVFMPGVPVNEQPQ